MKKLLNLLTISVLSVIVKSPSVIGNCLAFPISDLRKIKLIVFHVFLMSLLQLVN